MPDKLYGGVLVKAASILDVLADDDVATITEISRTTGISQSTVSKITATLESIGFVQRDEEKKTITLGTGFLRYARAATGTRRLVLIAEPHLVMLNRAIDETIHLGVVAGDKIVYADKIDPQHKYIYMTSQIGAERALYCTAMGKAVLATYSPQDLDRYIARTELRRFTANTITDPDELRRAVEQARINGYGVDDEEQESEGYCVGTALMRDGRLYGAISASFPKYRLTEEYQEKILRELFVAKARIEAEL
ncbi:DNA-binding transcriptional regulator, IclR family [Propionibacterium cyclohexanicum]|uniref:DNA-binding transcriptional regulator, IclR family n=1 Tax=Propionibacterium cyclohexanicum TaxID=64702 RepID=A0A1H9U1H3_9ACTN|nr:DNA-binding transcriptional regulator, IclR family [Propionibacterium cyclohexanicum]